MAVVAVADSTAAGSLGADSGAEAEAFIPVAEGAEVFIPAAVVAVFMAVGLVGAVDIC